MKPIPMKVAAGFTLLELMVTVGVAAVLAAVAIPNMREFSRNNRLVTAANDLLRATQVARSEAIKRRQVVGICATNTPNASNAQCVAGAFTGWIVFQDTNNNWVRDATEPLIDSEVAPSNITVLNNNQSALSYAPSGFANVTAGHTAATRIVACDSRGNRQVGNDSVARTLIVEATGRARVSRLFTDVSTSLGLTGGTCS